VASPLLANIYLHYVLDLWAERWRRHEAIGDMIIVRYADDVVAGFEHEDDARRFLDAMRARFKEFALSLHPEKTRLIEFGRHAAANREKHGVGKPETFNFLGFTFFCAKSRRGNFLVKRKTRRDRMKAKLQEVKGELRRRMHQPAAEERSRLAGPHRCSDRRTAAHSGAACRDLSESWEDQRGPEARTRGITEAAQRPTIRPKSLSSRSITKMTPR
jgi:hypothetical protein